MQEDNPDFKYELWRDNKFDEDVKEDTNNFIKAIIFHQLFLVLITSYETDMLVYVSRKIREELHKRASGKK